MKQYIEQIFKLGYRKFSGKSNKEFGVQTKENIKLLCDEIRTFLLSSNLKVDKPGVGTGGWIAVPYVRVFDENEAPSATNGVYIVYLFADTEDSVFLTLNQGVKGSSPEEYLKVRDRVQHDVDSKDFLENKEKINCLGNYGEPTIFYKEYKRGALPSEDVLREDLKKIVSIYKEYLGMASNEFHLQQGSNREMETIQKIIYGAPGTGKSYYVKEIVSSENILQCSAEIRRTRFVDSVFCKKNYDSYLNTSIPKLLNVLVYEADSIESLKNIHTLLKSSEDGNASDYASGLNGYIRFVENELQKKVFRTTFHPDYDYAQFVGSYKPNRSKSDPEKIIYSFSPQVFSKAYVTAWELLLRDKGKISQENQVYLIIEEINRGNCAQIFGDIFQLLDRDDKGFSNYSIDIDRDFADWLKTDEEDGLKTDWEQYIKFHYEKEGKTINPVSETKIALPPNLNILATMNTSDQSLFPMDSAFKRRFDWEYVPIRYEVKKNEKGEKIDKKWNADTFKVSFEYKEGNKKKTFSFDWLPFLKKINDDIYKVTESEDKQMGEFFIKPKNASNEIGMDEFRSKVLFYLWDSVYKDEKGNSDAQKIFHFTYPGKDGSAVTFQSLFADDFVDILKKMLENLDEAYKGSKYKGLNIQDKEK